MIVPYRLQVIAGIVALMGASAPLAQASAPSAPIEPASEIVPLYVSTSRPLAFLTIGDNPPSPVAFDTGTDENILDPAYAARLGLKVMGHSPLLDAATGAMVDVPVAAIPGANLGGVSLSTTSAQLLNHKFPGEVGVFGPGSFKGRYVIIEGELNRLRIVSKESGLAPPGPGHAYHGDLPAIGINVAGRQLDATLDSGNDDALTLGGDLLKSVRLKSPATVVAIAQSALGQREVLGGELAGVALVGPYRFQSPQVTFAPSGHDANIGFAVIRHLNIILDPEAKRSWILDPATERVKLSDFTGRFGPRSVRLEKGRLIHQRDGRDPIELRYLGGDLFEMPATGDRLQFFRRDGRVVRLELISADGEVIAPADRTA